MSLNTRLKKLYATARLRGLAPGSCPACRDRRGRHVLVDAWQPGCVWPAPCAVCGEVPEFIIEVHEVVVESREEPP